eukprot:RCo045450
MELSVRRESSHERAARLQIEGEAEQRKKQRNRERRERKRKREEEEEAQQQQQEAAAEAKAAKGSATPSAGHKLSFRDRLVQRMSSSKGAGVGLGSVKKRHVSETSTSGGAPRKGSEQGGGEAPGEIDWVSAGIEPLLLKGLKEGGFVEPTPIQRATLNAALSHRCVMAASETGSGKTLAFGVPILHHILRDWAADKSSNDPERRLLSSLMITPTRELAMQIQVHLLNVAKYTAIQIVTIVGGIYEEKQIRLLKSRPHILICTPGRLKKLMTDESPSEFLTHSISAQLKYLVLDEADRLLAYRHFTDLNEIIDVLCTEFKSDPGAAEGAVSLPLFGEVAGLVPSPENAKDPETVRTFESTVTEFNGMEDFLRSLSSATQEGRKIPEAQLHCVVPEASSASGPQPGAVDAPRKE